jgi:hypothetical protein
LRVRTVLLLTVVSCGVLAVGACGSDGEQGRIPPGADTTTTPATTTSQPVWPTAAGGGYSAPTAAPSSSPTPVPKVFDAEAMRESVKRILTESYGIDGVQSVTCPPNQPVEAGSRFDCHARIDGESTRVPITVQGEDDQYKVGYPE